MKKIKTLKMKLLTLKIVLAGFLLVIISKSNGQTNVRNEIKALYESQGYTLSDDDFFTISEVNNNLYKYRNFYSGTEYIIVVYPEESGINDLDLYLYDSDGSLLSKDSDSQPVAIVEYEPYTSRQMKVVVKLYDAYSSTYNYDVRLLIFYR